jgi:hypothetical protein
VLDPPYFEERCEDLYAEDSTSISADVRKWAVANGDDPLMRIVLCGYEGEHEIPADWSCVSWKTKGGYASQRTDGINENQKRERLWFSPHCLQGKQSELFS